MSNSVITPKSAIPYRNRILVLSYIREYDMKCGLYSAASVMMYSAIYVTTPQMRREETPQSGVGYAEFDLERRGKSGFACRGTYCPLRNSATPRRDR
jgi:hypothetical protein